MQTNDRSFVRWCLLLFIAAFVFRVALTARFVGFSSPPDREAGFDQVDYELFAWRLAEGHGYTLEDGTPTARRMPGTSLALLPIYAFAGREYLPGRIWFCILSAATCVACAYVGKRVFDQTVGLTAGAMLAFYPNHAYYAMHFFSEAPGVLCATFATYCTLRAWPSQSRPSWLISAGIAWGIAGLFRPNILLSLPILAIFAFILALRKRDIVPLARMLVMGIIAALVLMPWVARNYHAMGILSLSTVNAPTFWGAHNHKTLTDAPGDWLPMSALVDDDHPLSGTEVERSKQMWAYSRAFVLENAWSMPYLTMMKLARFLSPFTVTSNRIVYWVFALGWITCVACMSLGIVLRPAGETSAPTLGRTEVFILITPFLAMLGTSLLYYGSIRFRDSAAPNYMVMAAFGVVTLGRYLAPKSSKDSSAIG